MYKQKYSNEWARSSRMLNEVHVAVVLTSYVFTTGSGAASTHHMAYEMRIVKIMAARGQDFQIHIIYPSD